MKTKLLLLLLLVNFSMNAQTNLVSNGDFETWTAFSQPTDWFRFSNGLLFQSPDAQNGFSSTKMEITSGTLHFMNSSPFATQAGKTYRVTLYHKLVSGSFSSIELSLTKTDAFKTTITKKTETTTVNTEWRKIEFDYVANTTQNAEISIWVTGTTGSQILIDNVSIVDVAEIGPKYTLIPDLNFENELIALGIDSGTADGKVLTSKASAVTALYLYSKNISDLTGIQDFKSLESLTCSYNKIASLDISSNLNLTTLRIDANNLTNLDVSKNTKLTELSCDSNKLTSLNLAFTTLLTNLSFSTNSITAIDVSNLKSLRRLSFSDCMLSTIDLSNNKSLISLLARRNKLKVLDVSENKELIHLDCDTNLLTALDVNALTKLEYLDFSTNPITSIDLKTNINLKALVCFTTQISTLDLSNNKILIGLRCLNNMNLSELNLKNGNNTNLLKTFTYWTGTNGSPVDSNFQNNLKLSCILVDNVAYSNTNWSALTDTPAIYTLDCASLVYTLIPDTNFELKLMALGIDKDGKNGKVLTSSISTVKDLNLQSAAIKDLTGLEDFTALENLTTPGNKILNLNVNKNIALKTLSCGNEDLTSLDLNTNTKLIKLYAVGNKFTTLNISKNLALESLDLTNNTLTSLDVENNINLTSLTTTLNTNLKSINVSKNTKLSTLEVVFTGIENLDVSTNTKLTSLSCRNSKLTSLDISNNPLLVTLTCQNNALKSLNLKNGKNTLFGTNLNFKNNTGLTCILVDDVSYSDTNWSAFKDVTANYSLDCTIYTLIPDSNFEDKLIALKIDKDGKNGKVATSSISSVTSLDISSSSIKDLTGIKDFTSLTLLNCSTNQLTSLTPANNLLLTGLNCSANQLTALNTANNLLLTDLNCSSNLITSIDVSKNKSLIALNVSNNNLTTLNVKNGFNTNMDWFSVNFTKNAALSCIQVDNAKYSNENWNGKLDKTSFFTEDCSGFTLIPDSNFEDKLIALKIDIDGKNGKVLTSSISKVTDLNVQLSDIKDLTGIQDFTALEFLNCQFNLLTSLNVTKNLKLIELYTHGNDLTTLNVSANTALTTLQVNKNKLTALDISKNNKLVYVNVSENALKTLNLKNGNNTNFTTANMFKNPALGCIQVDNPSFATTSSVFSKDAAASYSATCTLGIEDSVFDKVILYPNPTKGEVNINNVVLEKVTVYNSLGQLVKSLVLKSGETTNSINLSGLPKGIYYIYLINEDAASAKKIILE